MPKYISEFDSNSCVGQFIDDNVYHEIHNQQTYKSVTSHLDDIIDIHSKPMGDLLGRWIWVRSLSRSTHISSPSLQGGVLRSNYPLVGVLAFIDQSVRLISKYSVVIATPHIKNLLI